MRKTSEIRGLSPREDNALASLDSKHLQGTEWKPHPNPCCFSNHSKMQIGETQSDWISFPPSSGRTFLALVQSAKRSRSAWEVRQLYGCSKARRFIFWAGCAGWSMQERVETSLINTPHTNWILQISPYIYIYIHKYPPQSSTSQHHSAYLSSENLTAAMVDSARDISGVATGAASLFFSESRSVANSELNLRRCSGGHGRMGERWSCKNRSYLVVFNISTYYVQYIFINLFSYLFIYLYICMYICRM